MTMNTVGSVKKKKKSFFFPKSGSETAHPVSTIIQYITGMTHHILPHTLFLQLEIVVLLLLPRNTV